MTTESLPAGVLTIYNNGRTAFEAFPQKSFLARMTRPFLAHPYLTLAGLMLAASPWIYSWVKNKWAKTKKS